MRNYIARWLGDAAQKPAAMLGIERLANLSSPGLAHELINKKGAHSLSSATLSRSFRG
jgi:hypothetical protein